MIGETLAHYIIHRSLGRGGMGEVYLATDTRLNRSVALKTLPEELSRDPERMSRFRKEAEAAARLNHPNIATIYSIEEAELPSAAVGAKHARHASPLPDSTMPFITMEYVDGKPLSELIPETGLPLETFFTWFLPLAEALSHAHERNIAHRDIKPANIMISVDGSPRILDFGLARIIGEETAGVDREAPTKTLTLSGSITGTPAYMSPEQALGQPGDTRSDIFSFGVVMYEALTGKRPFTGEHYMSVVSSTLKDEPPSVGDLKPVLPYTLSRVTRHCLQKNIRQRYQSMLDVYRDLLDAKEESVHGPLSGTWRVDSAAALSEPSRWTRPASLAMMALFLVVMTTLTAWWLGAPGDDVSSRPVRKFQIALDNTVPGGVALSPDGATLAFIQKKRLNLRSLDQIEAREIPESEGAEDIFWSPDSRKIGYRIRRTLWTSASDGSDRRPLCDLPEGRLAGIHWGSDGRVWMGLIAFPGQATLFSAPERGGELTRVAEPDSAKSEWGLLTPYLIPGTEIRLYSVWKKGAAATAAALAERYREDPNLRFLISLAGVTSSEIVAEFPDGERRRLPIAGDFLSVAGYTPSGHLLYYRDAFPGQGDLWAVAFSPGKETLSGEPFPVARGVGSVSAGADGALLYRSLGQFIQELALVDRRGRVEETVGQPQERISDPVFSPDEKRVVVEGMENGQAALYLHDRDRGLKTRLTFTDQDVGGPTWTSDGRRILFQMTPPLTAMTRGVRKSVIMVMPAEGGGTITSLTPDSLVGASPVLSRDGATLVFTRSGDIWHTSLKNTTTPRPVLQTPEQEWYPALSPDGRYLAYVSNQAGQPEVFVTRFPSGEGRWQVSTKGGWAPRWSPDGDELFYVEGDALMSVSVDKGRDFLAGRPEPLFDAYTQAARLRFSGFDVSRDGARFLIVRNNGGTAPVVTIVENWIREFQQP